MIHCLSEAAQGALLTNLNYQSRLAASSREVPGARRRPESFQRKQRNSAVTQSGAQSCRGSGGDQQQRTHISQLTTRDQDQGLWLQDGQLTAAGNNYEIKHFGYLPVFSDKIFGLFCPFLPKVQLQQKLSSDKNDIQ